MTTVLRNYRLFSLQRVLSVQSVPDGTPTRDADDDSASQSTDTASISAVASGAGAEFHLVAVACKASLIFRYSPSGGTPMVRQMRWFEDPARHVATMAFDPGAEYLVCVTQDASIFIVPAYELVVGTTLTSDTTPSLAEYARHGGSAR